MQGPETLRFPPTPIALKMAVAVGIGMLVGLEREWSNKDVGIRTFAIVSMVGMLAGIVGPQIAITSLIGIFLLVGGDEWPEHPHDPFIGDHHFGGLDCHLSAWSSGWSWSCLHTRSGGHRNHHASSVED